VASAAPPEPPPLLERIGVAYFRSLSRGVTVVDVDGVHYLNPEERAALRRVARGTVLRAAVAGALSSVVSVSAELLALPLIAPDAAGHVALSATVRFWGIVIGATALASALEIGFLYWDALRSVHRLAVVAGLDVFGDARAERSAVAGGLARAALELPNPTGGVFGVNARREASRFELAVASLVYKLKISVTNFVLKALVRRMLGRTALRSYLQVLVPFVAIPITAAWNAIVAYLVLREARLRAMGPSASHVLAGHVLGTAEGLSPEGRVGVLRAVASSIVRTEDLHPNLTALLHEVVERVGHPDQSGVDDPHAFLALVHDLPKQERPIVLRMLVVAAVLDGRLSRKERHLLRDAYAAAGARLDLGAVHALRKAIVRGDTVERAMVEAVAE
jgi:hypothetical protein